MEKIISTYGKTWHTWPMREDARLPLGARQLMMDFTADGQINPALFTARDSDLTFPPKRRRPRAADSARSRRLAAGPGRAGSIGARGGRE
jgi:hypothetical protein